MKKDEWKRKPYQKNIAQHLRTDELPVATVEKTIRITYNNGQYLLKLPQEVVHILDLQPKKGQTITLKLATEEKTGTFTVNI